MGSIIKSSKFVNSLYDNEKEYSEELELDYNAFLNEQFLQQFQIYNNTHPNSKLTVQILNEYITGFEKLGLHCNFQKPSLNEYFNKKLNFLLLIDFLLSLNKEGIINNSQNFSSQLIFDFFVNLSHFYNYMSFLEVDEKFIEYIKYMLVLYLQSLNRVTIESNFGHVIWELDQFFKYEVIKHVYLQYDRNLSSNLDIKHTCEKYYHDQLKNYDKNKNYIIDSDYLDYFFKLTHHRIGYIVVQKYEIVDDVDDDDDDDDDDDVDEYRKFKYNIEEEDPNFETYKTLFIYRRYQLATNMIDDFDKFIKLSKIGIKNFNEMDLFFSVNSNTPNEINYKNKFLTYVGEILNNYNKNEVQELFMIAYEMCHFDIIKEIINKNHDLGTYFELKNDIGYNEINNLLISKFQKFKTSENITTIVQLKNTKCVK